MFECFVLVVKSKFMRRSGNDSAYLKIDIAKTYLDYKLIWQSSLPAVPAWQGSTCFSHLDRTEYSLYSPYCPILFHKAPTNAVDLTDSIPKRVSILWEHSASYTLSSY